MSAYTIPTDAPEGDGTLRWDSTTLIVCEVHAAGRTGLGYTYGNQASAMVADHLAAKFLTRRSAIDVPAAHASMVSHVRNDGSRGITSMAISALDVALWDLKAKLFDCSMAICSAPRRMASARTEVAGLRLTRTSNSLSSCRDGPQPVSIK